MKNRKGFTLIELLIVIAIIAVLSVVVILSLNPAELLRQARDSNRISDMATLKSAISLYLADVASPSMGTSSICYISLAGGAGIYEPTTTGVYSSMSNCVAWMITATSSVNATTSRGIGVLGSATSSNGWLPVSFNGISSGSPIGQDPIDPVNASGTASCVGNSGTISLSNCGLLYSYVVSGTSFKIATMMESKKYTQGGAGDVETSDGGNNPYVYEGGTLPTL